MHALIGVFVSCLFMLLFSYSKVEVELMVKQKAKSEEENITVKRFT